jgi:hypothetical protein
MGQRGSMCKGLSAGIRWIRLGIHCNCSLELEGEMPKDEAGMWPECRPRETLHMFCLLSTPVFILWIKV